MCSGISSRSGDNSRLQPSLSPANAVAHCACRRVCVNTDSKLAHLSISFSFTAHTPHPCDERVAAVPQRAVLAVVCGRRCGSGLMRLPVRFVALSLLLCCTPLANAYVTSHTLHAHHVTCVCGVCVCDAMCGRGVCVRCRVKSAPVCRRIAVAASYSTASSRARRFVRSLVRFALAHIALCIVCNTMRRIQSDRNRPHCAGL